MRTSLTASVTAEAAATNDFIDAVRMSNPDNWIRIHQSGLSGAMSDWLFHSAVYPVTVTAITLADAGTEMFGGKKGVKGAAVTDIHANFFAKLWHFNFHVQSEDECRNAQKSNLNWEKPKRGECI